ncbi:MAG: hypothetical protein A6F71_04675 [Cycloclasticus sp. symbiont of Poecilosclerida sp. M]|nr:MAG: hypothetical protein A6F71_04675 [Cycloclasticus sp. symbiont of Poecilosclerida sp. M]
MALIKNKQICSDGWPNLKTSATSAGRVIVSHDEWLKNKDELILSGKRLGLTLEADEKIDEFLHDIGKFSLIIINIASFADGRAYSLAKTLRFTHQFKGEIRAIGDVLPDQALYLTRVGFDALQLPDNKAAELTLQTLAGFSAFYQPN